MVAIKLGLSEDGLAPSFYRRISVETINQTGISLLKRQAVLLFQGNECGDAAAVDLENFAVTLFYVDSDGDRVLIATEKDLAEAIEEGQSQVRAAIKVHATVTLRADRTTKSTQTFVPNITEAGTVVDALTDLSQELATAVRAGAHEAARMAQEARSEHASLHLAAHQQAVLNQMQQQAVLSQEAKLGSAPRMAKVQLKHAKAVSKEQYKFAKREVKESARAAKRQVKESARAAKMSAASSKEALKKTIRDQNARAPQGQNAQKTVVEGETPFIHGRHTCDLCLNSPIIGKRFHATNLPDYDLCGTCHDNYKGSDITFKEMALDRDQSMQERWARKYDRMVQINNAKDNKCNRGAGPRGRGVHTGPPRGGPPHFGGGAPFGRRFGPPCGPPCGPPPHGHRFGPPPHVPHIPPPPHVPHWGPPQSAGPYVNPVQTESSWDSAMAEAVRRSLEEENKPKEAPAPAPKEEDVAALSSVSRSHTATAPSDDVAVAAAAVGKVAAVAVQALSRLLDETPSPATLSEDAKVPAKEEVQVETVEDDEESPNAPEEESDAVAEEEAPAEKEVVVADEEPQVEETVEEEKVSADEVVAAPVDAPVETEQEDTQRAVDSFSSDAVDSGSVAAFMGATLDRFSEAIDSLNSEMEGATIVDGETNVDDEDDSSKDSWSVVEDEQISHDENLARAAVMIGSALFNSDNNVSSQSSSQSHISSITSVPSEMPSLLTRVSQAQMDRWSKQLDQLHEMGLDDDAKYVEVMEMLAAANIGSGEDDEISVTQVLDHTM